jgi:hypothetical protein
MLEGWPMRRPSVVLRIALGLGLVLAVARTAEAQSAGTPPPAVVPSPAPAPPPEAAPPPEVVPAPASPPPPEAAVPPPPEVAPPPDVPPPPEVPPPPPLIAPPPEPAPSPSGTLAEEISFAAPPLRPRMALAIGMGATLDATGFAGGAHAIPAFAAEGGFGDGLAGFDLGAYATSASGRFSSADLPVDRLALDAFGVVRPAARWHRDDQRYQMRVLHLLAAELGLGFERDGTTTGSGTRFVIHTGARAEFPLTSGMTSEVRLRLGVRRAIGLFTPIVAVGGPGSGETVSVGDSTEFFGALAVVF